MTQEPETVHVGIDIGTTNTVIAYVEQGRPMAHVVDSEVLVPSAIYVDETAGHTDVGKRALDAWADPSYDARLSYRRWKLAMGDQAALGELRIGGGKTVTRVTPELLTTWLVEHVVEAVSAGTGGRPVASAVVTVPHGWRRIMPEKSAATRTAAAAARHRSGPLAGSFVTVQDLLLSEPVAAASYWLWETRRGSPESAKEYVGRTVLVVDIGGGTVDLSLVRVGTPDQPLVVIDAINNDAAGDLATALLLGWVAGQAAGSDGLDLPTDPDQLLQLVAGGDTAWVRAWFLEAQRMLVEMSTNVRRVRPGHTPRGCARTFEWDDASVYVKLDAETLTTVLEPFYAAGRELVGRFLDLLEPDELPHAVVFAGGGSRIAGVRDLLVRPALERRVPDPDAVLDRITLNDERIDKAVALGAALVAAGEVTVEERLLNDVGMAIMLPPLIARELGLGDAEIEVFVSPLLRRTSKLPATATTREMGLDLSVQGGEQYEVKLVVFDDPDDPFIQEQTLRKPVANRVSAQVRLTADTDGALTCGVEFEQGHSQTTTARLDRVRAGRASFILETGLPDGSRVPVVDPAALKAAADRLRTAGSTTAPSGGTKPARPTARPKAGS